uniref:Uncharacterized protein n=1 Tax=Rhizophora mucronata TaxID=61149 RepID=A0A2P2QUW1_RHIMU
MLKLIYCLNLKS